MNLDALNAGQSQASNKPRRLIARFSEAEYQAFLKRSSTLETTRSRLLRYVVREFLGMGPDLFGLDLKAITQGIYQLGALGRNLNQQLRAVHSGQMTGQSVDLALMGQIKAQLMSLESDWIA